jgi:hypothetical protein
MMSGVIEHFAQRRASTREEARAGLDEIIARQGLGPAEAAEALTATAAGYLEPDRWYREDALAVLAAAGADLDRAARIQALRSATPRIRFGDAEL